MLSFHPQGCSQPRSHFIAAVPSLLLVFSDAFDLLPKNLRVFAFHAFALTILALLTLYVFPCTCVSIISESHLLCDEKNNDDLGFILSIFYSSKGLVLNMEMKRQQEVFCKDNISY